MASCCCCISNKKPGPIIASFVSFLLFLLVSFSASATASATKHGSGGGNGTTQVAFHSGEELVRFQRIEAQLARIRKASVKTIQSPDGDVIDCVPSHLQPAFEHPKLRGQKPEDAPAARPRSGVSTGHGNADAVEDDEALPQAWRDSGESCPEGTIPVRRTTEGDLLRASSVGRFGMKPRGGGARRDSTGSGHEKRAASSCPKKGLSLVTLLNDQRRNHKRIVWGIGTILALTKPSVADTQVNSLQHAVGYVTGGQFYGAKASLNVWPAQVASPAEFSLSQIWVISGSFGNDLNTIEAGWQVSPQLYGDNNPRFFTYWTNDAYQETGCYNLHCSGFVQTNNRFAIGAAISPISAYSGRQFDITLLIWKDPKQGHWWLQLGSGALVGYWPSFLFSHLGARADMVQFGGEVVNTRPSGSHTPTQMGSGRFPGEGYGRAAYFRNVQVVDWDNNLIPAAGLRLLADHPGCYDIAGYQGGAWGSYFYYGGPGRNVRCP